MTDKPEDVGIKVLEQLLNGFQRGTLAQVGIAGQHTGIEHLLRFGPELKR